MNRVLLLVLMAVAVVARAAEPVSLDVEGGTLHGVLEMPATEGPVPLVLMHVGSGPTDRDGNNPLGVDCDAFRLLAEALAGRGIASLRYDKRGVAASAPAGRDEASLRFDTYVDDLVAWGRNMDGDPRFSHRIVLGHSEGSQIGATASRRMGADGFVSVCGPGSRPADLIRDQLRPQLPESLFAEADSILAALERGEPVADPPASLGMFFRPGVQPYMISWFRNDPRAEIAALDVPVLIVRGTADLQVPTGEGDLLASARPDARLATIEDMNHVLKRSGSSTAEQMTAYGDPSLPLAPGLVDVVAGFVNEIAGQGGI